MYVLVDKLKETADLLQEIVEAAEVKNITRIETSCNTYRLDTFLCFGPSGYLSLDAEELFEKLEREED